MNELKRRYKENLNEISNNFLDEIDRFYKNKINDLEDEIYKLREVEVIRLKKIIEDLRLENISLKNKNEENLRLKIEELEIRENMISGREVYLKEKEEWILKQLKDIKMREMDILDCKSEEEKNIYKTVIKKEKSKENLYKKKVLEKIENQKWSFSGKQLVILEYICENFESIPKYKKATKLAKELNVSTTTLTVVLLRLNLGVYNEFIKKIEESIKE